jgi:hypothetical protein
MDVHEVAQYGNIMHNSEVTEALVSTRNNTVRKEAGLHRNVTYDDFSYWKRHSSGYNVFSFYVL